MALAAIELQLVNKYNLSREVQLDAQFVSEDMLPLPFKRLSSKQRKGLTSSIGLTQAVSKSLSGDRAMHGS